MSLGSAREREQRCSSTLWRRTEEKSITWVFFSAIDPIFCPFPTVERTAVIICVLCEVRKNVVALLMKAYFVIFLNELHEKLIMKGNAYLHKILKVSFFTLNEVPFYYRFIMTFLLLDYQAS